MLLCSKVHTSLELTCLINILSYHVTLLILCVIFMCCRRYKLRNERIIACEQALRGALAVGRDNEGQIATTSLEFEYLSRKSRCEMLIGGDDVSDDVITLGTCFQCLVTFAFVSASCSLAEIWQLSQRGIRGGIKNSRKVVASFLPFPAPPPERSGE